MHCFTDCQETVLLIFSVRTDSLRFLAPILGIFAHLWRCCNRETGDTFTTWPPFHYITSRFISITLAYSFGTRLWSSRSVHCTEWETCTRLHLRIFSLSFTAFTSCSRYFCRTLSKHLASPKASSSLPFSTRTCWHTSEDQVLLCNLHGNPFICALVGYAS